MDTIPLLSNVVVKIIEELTDGLIILNEKREILFFNEMLLRMTGWRSKDILTNEKAFVEYLDLDHAGIEDRHTVIPDSGGRPDSFEVSCFKIMGEEGFYFLIRVRPTDRDERGQDIFKEHYRILFNNIDDPLLTADLNGNIIEANPAFFSMLDMSPDEAPANIADLYVYRHGLEEKIMKLTSTGAISNLETHLYTKDRNIRRILDFSWIIKDSRGIIRGYTSQFKDITYLKNLESKLQISEHNYIMLFDTVIASIVIVDPLGNIINRNYAAEELYGYSWDEVVGRSYDELFRGDRKRPTLKQIFSWVDQNNGRYVESNAPRLCEGNETKYTYTSYTWMKNSMDEIVAYAIMERDFTERVKLEKKLRHAFEAIKETQSAAILGFARLTEYRDKDTGKHLDRIKNYTKLLATELRRLPQYRDYITDNYIEDLCLSSVLHDIGKVGIEDAILLKKGKLTEKEFKQIKEHVRIGGEALRSVDRELKSQSFLTIGKEIAFSHHEWWNGQGYPLGLKGDKIPLSARIVAIADVYDALTTERPYKKALTHEKAVKEIERERGTHFDPEIVDIFLRKHEDFARIKLFGEFQEHPESIDVILREKLPIELTEGYSSETADPKDT